MAKVVKVEGNAKENCVFLFITDTMYFNNTLFIALESQR